MAFCEPGVLQERSGAAVVPRATHGSSPGRTLPCDRGPAGAPAWPGKGRVAGHLGPPGFAGQRSAAPRPLQRFLPPGSPGGCVRHSLRSSRFVGLVLLLPAKRQSREGKGLQSSDVVRRCPWALFTIVISGGMRGGRIYL